MFLLYLWLTQLWSPNFAIGEFLEDLLKVACTVLFVLLTAKLREEHPRLVVMLFKGMMIVAAATAVLAVALAEDFGPPQRLVGFGRADHPIIGGAIYAIAALGLISVFTWRRPSRREGILYGLTLVPVMAFVILTGSRGVLIALLGTLTLWAVFRRNYVFLSGVLVLVSIGAASIYEDVLGYGAFLDRGTSYRLEIWGQTLDRIKENPWFGISYVTQNDFVMANGSVIEFSHNVILSNQLYGGIVATALLLAIAVVVGRRAVQAIRQDGEFTIGLLFLFGMICGLFDFTITPKGAAVEYLYFWLPIGLAVGRQQSLSNSRRQFEGERGLRETL